LILYAGSLVDFEVKPKGRPKVNRKTGGVYCGSTKNQTDLATLLLAYRKKKPIDEPCIMSLIVHLGHMRHCDWDNICKQVMDALEEARIVTNDRLIRGADKVRLYQKKGGPNTIVVTLESYEGK
jgi:Holliday junction resolvase RusA-like endonuclease